MYWRDNWEAISPAIDFLPAQKAVQQMRAWLFMLPPWRKVAVGEHLVIALNCVKYLRALFGWVYLFDSNVGRFAGRGEIGQGAEKGNCAAVAVLLSAWESSSKVSGIFCSLLQDSSVKAWTCQSICRAELINLHHFWGLLWDSGCISVTAALPAQTQPGSSSQDRKCQVFKCITTGWSRVKVT